MYESIGLKVRGLVFEQQRAFSVTRCYADDWTEKALQQFAREFDELLTRDFSPSKPTLRYAAALCLEIGVGPNDLVLAAFKKSPPSSTTDVSRRNGTTPDGSN